MQRCYKYLYSWVNVSKSCYLFFESKMMAYMIATSLKMEWNCEKKGHYQLNPATLCLYYP